MDKKIVFFALSSLLLLCFSCEDSLRDSDYYYQPSDNSFGKIEEGSIRDDGTFSMEPLIYPTIKEFEEYDDYVLARQEPNIDDYYRITQIDSSLVSSQILQSIDSVNHLIDRLNKLKECYWIVQKSTKKVYGPLKKTEFDNLSKKLNVKKKVPNNRIRVYRLYL